MTSLGADPYPPRMRLSTRSIDPELAALVEEAGRNVFNNIIIIMLQTFYYDFHRRDGDEGFGADFLAEGPASR